MSEVFEAPQSRIEAILQNMLGADNEILPPFSRNEILLLKIAGMLGNIENDVANKQDNLFNSTKWKKLGDYTLSGDVAIDTLTITIPDAEIGYLTNANYTRFKLVFDITAIADYTDYYFPISAYLLIGSSRGYSLYYTSSASGAAYRAAGDSTFKGEILITRRPETDAQNFKYGVDSVMLSSRNDAGAICRSSNGGNFENGATASTVRNVRIAATRGVSNNYRVIAPGSKIEFYAYDESEE